MCLIRLQICCVGVWLDYFGLSGFVVFDWFGVDILAYFAGCLG